MEEMHMKHFKMTALAACAVLVFGFAACSSGDDSPSNNNNNTNGNGGGGNTSYTVTIASTIENGTVTADKTSAVAGDTVKLTATPADGYTLDSFSVTDANTNAITVTNGAFTMPASNVTVSATFKQTTSGGDEETTKYTVTIASGIENGTVTASPTSAAEGETITLTATPSTGYQLATLTVQNGTTDVTVTNNTFTMPAGNVTVTATFKSTASGGDDTPTTTTYTVTVNAADNGTVTADKTSAAAGAEVTLTVTPGSGYELDTLAVTDASNNTVTVTDNKFTMPESNVTVSATFKGTSTNPTYIGTKAPSEAKAVGDIVFTDGSATPYASDLTLTDDQKAKAIAVIFYVGTELNSGDDTTSRTLGVGLAHNTSGLAWCTSSAKAYSKNITTIQCPASGSAGALTFTGDKNGSDNLSQIGTFLASNNSTDDDDTATEANYPAFYFAKNYASQKIGSESESRIAAGSDYASDWYLPTIAELFQIWKNRATVDAASQLCGGSQFSTNVYWSSSQYASDDTYAYLLSFYNGYCASYNKPDVNKYVCAVRAFN